ncbi:hypothetical protein EIP91_011236 [Steccherinum ochraceum]|uniref:X-box-binding protein 1 n=1 Tax=Steccherinum ochraceum TaxID=92696 RepID=A0A4R0RI73_9APHY|nr:hypothetical protein EIP91_011236 [Steccherinum ochraceum]
MKRDADSAFGSQAGSSSISLPSPPVDAPSPQSPYSESPELSAEPSRKRSRSEVTPEERKEARAHRNRIAAQNSRDRRKAQFSLLETRVAELEEENRKLRAGMSLAELSRSVEPSHEQRERELARERENAELKEKIKTLENGWEAVMKALAASGLPLTLPSPANATSSSTPSSSSDSASQPPTATFPVILPPNPIFPLSPAPTASPTLSSHIDFDESDSTRHLARVAITDAPPLSSLELPPSTPYSTADIGLSPEATSAVDEMAMEDLFREILASPSIPSASLPAGAPTGEITSSPQVTSTMAAPPLITIAAAEPVDWEGEMEMQRLLDLLPVVQPEVYDESGVDGDAEENVVDFPSALELELCGWDINSLIQHPPSNSMVGAF